MSDLSKYYRVPGISITLPSRGLYNDFETSFNGEIEVFPFTAKDEMYLLNPDSLLNGSALEHVIKSCTPGLRCNPGDVLMCDIDSILIAAKYSTYGDEINMETSCPKCNNVIKFNLSIQELLMASVNMEEKAILRSGTGLEFRLKPLSLKDATKLQLDELHNTSVVQEILNTNSSIEARSMLLRPTVGSMVDSAINSICYCIESILIIDEDIEITEFSEIKSFISNIPSKLTSAIQEKQSEFSKFGIPKTTEIECKDCGHKWQNKITLDPASFFE